MAITTESVENRQQITNDFIRKLDELLGKSRVSKPFQLVTLNDYQLDRIKTVEDAGRVLEECDCKFMLWGIVRKERKINNEDFMVLDVRSLVFHDRIVESVATVLSQEMGQLLPARVLISKTNDLLELEFNAQNINLAARYIIAEAAALSKDFEYALELFDELQDELSHIDLEALPERLRLHVQLLRKKVHICQAWVNVDLSKSGFEKWRKSRQISDLEEAMPYVIRADSLIPNMYPCVLRWSIYHFVCGDIKKARSVLIPWASTNVADATWAINIAFLYLFEGNLRQAKRYYDIAMRREFESVPVLEAEEFMEWILKDSPEKYQINYGLGMINYFVKEEPNIAREYFVEFLSLANKDEFTEQVAQVKDIVENIDAKRPYKRPKLNLTARKTRKRKG